MTKSWQNVVLVFHVLPAELAWFLSRLVLSCVCYACMEVFGGFCRAMISNFAGPMEKSVFLVIWGSENLFRITQSNSQGPNLTPSF